MNVLPYLIVSAVLLAAAIVLTFLPRLRRRTSSALRLTAISVLVILSIMVMRMPLLFQKGELPMTATMHSMIKAVNTIGMGGDLDGVLKDGAAYISDGKPDVMTDVYAFYVTFQSLVSPLMCGFVLISTLGMALSKLRLLFCKRPVFIFSQLTEDSLILAQSILDSMHRPGEKRPRSRALLCFLHPGADVPSGIAPMWEKLHAQGAIRVRDSLSRRIFPRLSPSVNCILCDQNEDVNLRDLVGLLEGEQSVETRRFVRAASIRYFIYAHSRQAERVIDSLSRDHIGSGEKGGNRIICMLNPKENLAVDILDSTPLHRFVATGEDGVRRLNVLIAGSSLLAERFLRNAYACGQMHDCRLSITLAAPDATAFAERLWASAPMLRRSEDPVVKINGELHFVDLSDAVEVADEALLREADYVFVAFEEDEVNIRCARRMRMIIERQKLTDARRATQPVAIVYAVEDTALSAMCRRIDQSEGNGSYTPCTMVPTGSRDRQNHTDVLFGHELLRRAFFMDRAYDELVMPKLDREGVRALQHDFIAFMNRAYMRRSSVATALHLMYRKHVYETLPPAQANEILSEVEHRRWNAYMIMSGFLPPTDAQLAAYFYRGEATHKSEELRLHPCIVTRVPQESKALWDFEEPVVDELDEVSRRLHRLTAERLHQVMTDNGQPCPAPEKISPQSVSRLLEAAGKIADPGAKKLAGKLVGCLFRDYKRLDLNIVGKTNDILNMASDPGILAALRLFWMEGE